MSASRDSSQKIAFVYSNLYKLYQKGKEAAHSAPSPMDSSPVVVETPAKVSAEEVVAAAQARHTSLQQSSGHVLKTGDLHKTESVKVTNHKPTEFLSKRIVGTRVAKPAVLANAAAAPKEAISTLKDNLKALNDLHARLRFMLQELEELAKD